MKSGEKRKNIRTNDGKQSEEYTAYLNAKARCSAGDKNDPNYRNYAGRGIKFLFSSFEELFREIGFKPAREYSLDRINNDGNYEPGNVRWATRKVQNNNQRPKTLDSYRTEEFRLQCAMRQKSKPLPKEFCRAHLGHKHSEESKLKMKQAWMRRKERAA